MLERYLGNEALLDEAVQQLVPQLCSRALEEQSIDAIAEPEIEVTQSDPLIFKATVPVRPTVELGDYHQIRVDPEPVEVAEEEVDKVVEQIRYQHAPWQPVERPVQFGDLVTMDVEGNIAGEPALNEQGVEYQVVKDFPSPVPGFAEQLEELEKNQEKEFVLSFAADHEASQLAGKEFRFKVLVSEIKEKDLPELDDEFAKSIGEGFETLAALRERVTSNLRTMAEAEARRSLEDKVMETLAELSQVDFPPVLVEHEIERLIRERESSVEGHIEDSGKSEEELKQELRPIAIKRVTGALLLGKVVEEEQIEVTEAQVDEEVEAMTGGAGEKGEELKKMFDSQASRLSLKDMLITRKAVRRLVDIALGSETEST
jgi:trigger factor